MTLRLAFDGARRPGNLNRRHEWIGGHCYPLDARRLLDPDEHGQYLKMCVARAVREPRSARNLAAARRAAGHRPARRTVVD